MRRIERCHFSNCSTQPALSRHYLEWRKLYRQYRSLLKRKKESFYRSKLHSERLSPRQMWKTFDQLLGRGHVPPSPFLSTAAFQDFFKSKTSSIYSSTEGAPPPSFSAAPSNCSFSKFETVSMSKVARTKDIRFCKDWPLSYLRTLQNFYLKERYLLAGKALSEWELP